MHLVLRVEVLPGVTPDRAAAETWMLAQRLGVVVVAMVHGVDLTARPNEDIEPVLRRWQHERMRLLGKTVP